MANRSGDRIKKDDLIKLLEKGAVIVRHLNPGGVRERQFVYNKPPDREGAKVLGQMRLPTFIAVEDRLTSHRGQYTKFGRVIRRTWYSLLNGPDQQPLPENDLDNINAAKHRQMKLERAERDAAEDALRAGRTEKTSKERSFKIHELFLYAGYFRKGSEVDLSVPVINLLADLRQYCFEHSINFQNADEVAERIAGRELGREG